MARSKIHGGAEAGARRHAGRGLDTLARLGYATKGAVYVIIGVLALQAAFGTGGQTTGSQGAIRTIADQPFGQILLVLTAVGLFGYALWRFVQAALDVEGHGSDAKGLVKRAGYAGSGVIYLLLAVQAASIAFGWSLGSGGGGGSKQEWTARLLSQPFGQWLVGAVGVVILGVAAYQAHRAVTAKFMERYDAGAMSARQRRWARRLGQYGLGARAVVFAIAGAFVIVAAWRAEPGQARGLSGALATLAGQSYGPWLLVLVAAGLVAYGVYCVSRARYSHFSA